MAPVQAARAGPAPCAFARGALGAEAQEASQPVFGSGGGEFGGEFQDEQDRDGPRIDVGGGAVGEAALERTWETATAGDPTFVTPAQACSSFTTVSPRFGIGGPTSEQRHVWDPPISPPETPRRAAPSRPPRCKDCGHYRQAVPHKKESNKKGQKSVCSVPDNERRPPDFPNRTRNRFDTSKPCPCAACTAYVARLPGNNV